MDMSQLETQQISIRMPKYLVQAIDRERKNYNVSRSQAIIGTLRKTYNDVDDVSDEYDRNYPYTDASKTKLLASFSEALEKIKTGKVDGRPIEELIAELEEMEVKGGRYPFFIKKKKG